MSATDTTTEAAPEAPASPPPAAANGAPADLLIEVDGKLVPNYDATIKPFEEGDVVAGEVVRIDKDEVLVDIGYKSEGVIPANELSIRRSVDPSEEVSLGEQVDALVLTKEDQEGRLVLSKKRARFEKAWRKIEAAAETGEPVEGSVIEVVKGGLILDLGVRGFLPASLVDIRRVHNLDEFKGQTLECKVIELNRSRNNVVLSRRAVLEEERKEVREQILGRLQPGMVVEGKISNIVDFGAFVDLEGIDGLIHISELSWSHVNHPSEVLSIGETVRVKVLDIDRDRQRISLGLKQTQEDPWQTVLNEYKPNDILEGKVTKVVAFGAFVEIVPGVEGLVHISELAEHHVETPSEVVQPGQETWVRILEIDEERRRISLSVKRAQRNDNLPLRDLIPPELQPGNEAPPAPESGVPDLDLSEEVFSEPPAESRPPGGSGPRGCGRRRPAAARRSRGPAAARRAGGRGGRGRGRRTGVRRTRGRGAGRGRGPRRTHRRRLSPARWPPRSGFRSSASRAAIAAGKSEALAALDRLGAATLSADAVVHELLGTEGVRDALVERWGGDVAPGGAVDRERVAAIVFERPEELGWLERTLHPLVGERIVAWRDGLGDGTPLAVVEVPLLFESGMEAAFDATISIVAADAVRAERAGVRGTLELEGREARQLSQEEKARRATYVVSNDAGLEELERELERVIDQLRRRAEAPDEARADRRDPDRDRRRRGADRGEGRRRQGDPAPSRCRFSTRTSSASRPSASTSTRR